MWIVQYSSIVKKNDDKFDKFSKLKSM